MHIAGGRRVHRTTSASQNLDDSETELEAMPHLDVSSVIYFTAWFK